MPFPSNLVKCSVGAIAALLVGTVVAACGSNSLVDGASPGVEMDSSAGDLCASPRPGCPCSMDGQTASCGYVKEKFGNYVTCAEGSMTCSGGQWGSCVASLTTFQSTEKLGGGGFTVESLGMSSDAGAAGDAGQTACVNNPCDPSCQTFVDNSNGVDGGPGLIATDAGGWTLPVTGGTSSGALCEVPGNWQAYYQKFPAGFDQADGPLPTTCTTGPDDCQYDLACSSGACTSRNPGQGGSCTGVDFTLGMPCYDGSHFTFEVCNRGSVAATSGILPIGHYTGSPSGNPATCNISINGSSGECDINLSQTPLQPGQCTQITPVTDPRCTGVSNDSGDQFYWANFHGTSTAPVLSECNTCNNLTETKDTAAGVSGTACSTVACSASAQCLVTLTGTVLDPAAQEPVFNAVVAIPNTGSPLGSGQPPAIPTGVPVTDSCAGAGFSALRAATTDQAGHFTLAGVPIQSQVTVVIQTGRWRRVETINTSACGCGATINLSPSSNATTCIGATPSCAGASTQSGYAGTAGCLTRLPRTQSEGNIPHIAIASGGCDPMECLLYRMGVSSSEFTDEKGTGRVHYFYGHGAGLAGGANHTLPVLEGFNSGIQDSGFETSGADNAFSGWFAGGYSSWAVGINNGGAYAGSYYGIVGPGWWGYGNNGEQDVLSQTFTAPPSTTSITYHYAPYCGGSGAYFQAVLMDLTAGTTTSSSQSCTNTGGAWQTGSLSITAGHAYTINFINQDNGSGTGTGIDQVTLNASNNTPSSLLDNYDLVMLPCDCGLDYNQAWGINADDPGRVNLVNFANVGGRLFTSHWGREWLERSGTIASLQPSPFPNVATWYSSTWGGQIGTYSNAVPAYGAGTCDPASNGYAASSCSTTGFFDTTGTVRSQQFSAWMGQVTGNSTSMTIAPARYDVSALAASSVRFVYGRSSGSGSASPDEDFDFTFDTPIGSASPLGRVMYTDMHLATGNLNPPGGSGPLGWGVNYAGTNYTFPNECPAQGTSLSQQELAAEYLLFDLGACVTGQPVQNNLPPLVTTCNGTNQSCAGGSDIGIGACKTDADCDEDFHCASGQCVWNGGSGYFEQNCLNANGTPGVDLTLGVPCGNGNNYDIPICNRGGGTLPAGTAIDLENDGNGGYGAWNCSTTNPPAVAAGSATCTFTTPVALGPGQCIDIDTSTPAGSACAVLETGHRDLYINWDRKVAECGTGFSGTGPGCMNNSSNTKATGGTCPPVCGGSCGPTATSATFTRDFQGVCPAGNQVVWHLFKWTSSDPGASNIVFTAFTADTQAQLGVEYTPAASLGTATGSAPNGAVDVDTQLLASGVPAWGTSPKYASRAWLRVNMTLNPDGSGNVPTLTGWNQSYDCVPSE